MPVSPMNKTEQAYAAHLQKLKLAGEIFYYKFEPLKLRLAKNTYYTPDFMIIDNNRVIKFHEVKGFWRDDARVKIKVAAQAFPFFVFIAVQKFRGGWKFETF